ncbi:hypothetical protein [Citrobacter braakii]|uniref:hypothetical protein n=1 Tax=Citrobacter braakii TaxID=57706 RepID=UPI003B521F1D
MPELTTEVALNILIGCLRDNIDCDTEIIFDNDEDNTDSIALLATMASNFRCVCCGCSSVSS